MRVIAGLAKGRRLRSLPGLETRPTSDLVRGALFNILMNVIEDADFLDLFAGTGAVGIEALSRGARSAEFVESDRRSLAIIRANLETTGLADRARVHGEAAEQAVARWARQQRQFDLIFLDPPYNRGLARAMVRAVLSGRLLRSGGYLIAEHHLKEEIDPGDEGRVVKQAAYGETCLTFITA
ncbi:MAG: 16S rRNA (guanine(966)-N(2))-methyltransferase RsmD [Bacillota bacterium]